MRRLLSLLTGLALLSTQAVNAADSKSIQVELLGTYQAEDTQTSKGHADTDILIYGVGSGYFLLGDHFGVGPVVEANQYRSDDYRDGSVAIGPGFRFYVLDPNQNSFIPFLGTRATYGIGKTSGYGEEYDTKEVLYGFDAGAMLMWNSYVGLSVKLEHTVNHHKDKGHEDDTDYNSEKGLTTTRVSKEKSNRKKTTSLLFGLATFI